MPYGYGRGTGVNYNAGGAALLRGGEAIGQDQIRRAKAAKAEIEAQGTVSGAQYQIDLAKRLGVIDDATAAKIRLMPASAQAKALISIQHGIVAADQQATQKRAEATQERQTAAQERQVAIQQRQQDASDRAAQLFEQHQKAIETGAQLGPGGNLQYFNGVPYRYNPNTGGWTADTALAAAEKPPEPPDLGKVQTQLTQAATHYQIPSEQIADAANQQHAAVFTPGDANHPSMFRNATEDERKSGSFSSVYYGDYQPDKDKDGNPVLNNALTKPTTLKDGSQGRPAQAVLPKTEATRLNNMQAQITGIPPAAQNAAVTTEPGQGEVVPGISAPGGAPVTFAPGQVSDLSPNGQTSKSAADVALASAAATQAAMSPGLSMGGAGTPYPATAIPTTFRTVDNVPNVPRAVPVDLSQVARAPQAFPGLGADLPPAPAVTPPTPEQVAMMGEVQGPPMPTVARRAPVAMPMAAPAPPHGSEAASGNVPIPPTFARSTPVPAGSTPSPSPPAQVLMVHPDDGSKLAGKTGYIDAAAVPKALDLGFKPASPDYVPPAEAESTPPAVPMPQS